MLFNSLSFAIFLPVVFILYWFITAKNLRLQNLLLLVSSYFFYACWDWRFLFLLIFSTLLDFFTGIKMSTAGSQGSKRFWFWLSISINIGFLGFFKYYNFFAESFADFIANFGLHVNPATLNVILPVGISFYTFHGLSYVIDIYKNRIPPERNFIDYSVFVSFFPLLVAGPIERATHLLPQIKKERVFDYTKAVDGLRQILWGLFKKVVIADQCAQYANLVFNNSEAYSGCTLFIGAVFFAFQIYGDFSGYSDIAIGTARLFGVDLLRNFAFPYFSRDIAEFWRRWHISLSSWFRDYLYIPLGGSKGTLFKKVRNVFIIFLVSGFWHGANWTFIVWGFLNAVYILPSIILNTNRANLAIVAEDRLFPSLKEFGSMLLTFILTVFAWIFFRSENVQQGINIIGEIFSDSFFSTPEIALTTSSMLTVLFTTLFMAVEWIGRKDQYGIAFLGQVPNRLVRYFVYYLLAGLVIVYAGSEEQFIYFQF